MVDYDVPDLHSVTITIIDGRDEVRGVMRMTVPWPDIKDVNTEQVRMRRATTAMACKADK